MLVILGGSDGAIGSADAAARRARRNIGDCRIEILPDAAHVLFIDDSDRVSTYISDFLSRPVPASEPH